MRRASRLVVPAVWTLISDAVHQGRRSAPAGTRTWQYVDLGHGDVEWGKQLLGGDDPKLRWRVGRAEDVPLDPPHALERAPDSGQ